MRCVINRFKEIEEVHFYHRKFLRSNKEDTEGSDVDLSAVRNDSVPQDTSCQHSSLGAPLSRLTVTRIR